MINSTQNILHIVPEMTRIPRIPANTHWKTIDLGSLGLEESNVNLNHLTHLKTVILTSMIQKRHINVVGCKYVMQENIEVYSFLLCTGIELQTTILSHITRINSLQCFMVIDNSLKRIPFVGLPRSVQILDVSKNNITALPKRMELEEFSKMLQCIDLRYNNIRYVYMA